MSLDGMDSVVPAVDDGRELVEALEPVGPPEVDELEATVTDPEVLSL